jgi:hypothetical protein
MPSRTPAAANGCQRQPDCDPTPTHPIIVPAEALCASRRRDCSSLAEPAESMWREAAAYTRGEAEAAQFRANAGL